MKRYLIYFIAVFLVVAFGSTWVTHRIFSDTPPFIITKLDELKSNSVLMDSIGGYRLFEYSYNEEKYKRGDTLKYSITIKGGKDDLIYEGVQVKYPSNTWELVSDTLIVQ